MSSCTFILSHGSVLEWKKPEKSYYKDEVPLADIVEQFNKREDLPGLCCEDNKSRLEFAGEYRITVSDNGGIIRARTKIPLSEVQELIVSKLPATIEVMQAPFCKFWLRVYRDYSESSINSPPVIELINNVISSPKDGETFDWLVSDINCITREELEKVLAEMLRYKILGSSPKLDCLFKTPKAAFNDALRNAF